MWWIWFFLLFLPKEGEDKLLKVLKEEIIREYEILKGNNPPAYYISYRVEDIKAEEIGFSFGAVTSESFSSSRYLDVQVRIGDKNLDSTHVPKGTDYFDYEDYSSFFQTIPLMEDEKAIKKILWKQTHHKFTKALERYQKVLANEKVKAQREDTSPDFSLAPIENKVLPQKTTVFSRDKWKKILKNVTSSFKKYPEILNGTANLEYNAITKYFVSSEGTAIRHPQNRIRIYLNVSTRTEDGQDLYLYESYLAFSEKELPSEKELYEKAKELSEKILNLRSSPEAEPYTGPAIFLPKATAVFFHEVLGHRLEGHRQKTEKEAQTFTKKVNEKILPEFISIIDDPTKEYFEGKPLAGNYYFDDEGVKAGEVKLVDKGILKSFLLSRTPITNFPESNGHGRGQIGRKIVARQGNLFITSYRGIPLKDLKKKLIEMIVEKGKPYGLVFADVSGGFTFTQRGFMQAFKVIPLEVYRIYPNGKEELVRGVDIVGTPISALETIIETGKEYDVFNGYCGAESGFIPVSAIAPSILVEKIEIEKKMKEMEKPPILKSPFEEGGVK